MTTPDHTLAARLARLKDLFDCAMRASDTDARECTLKKAIYLSELDVAYRSNQLITTAEADARVKAAVLADREAAKSMVWTLGHEIKASMLVDEDNEQAVLDMVKATAAAIRSRGVTG